MAVHCLFVVSSLALFMALLASGIAFFSPFWLGNVGQTSGLDCHAAVSNMTSLSAWRGLWAQCDDDCLWFWTNDFQLQNVIFTKLPWHLATQVLYTVAAFIVLFCEVFARVQLCCRARIVVYRTIGFTLLTSFVIQAAALAVFGGFAHRDCLAMAFVDRTSTYLAWGYWMAVTGGGLTLLSGILFLLLECVDELDK